MDSYHIRDRHKWIYFKLGWTYFIQSRCPVEESLERPPVLHLLILNECDVCQFGISISWGKWESSLLSIHVYSKMLWETKYKEDHELICNGLFPTLYQVLFSEEAPCLSPEGQKIVNEYGDWYMTPDKVYIRIINSTKPLHWLPHLVPNYFLLQKISYQTYVNGVATSLTKIRKDFGLCFHWSHQFARLRISNRPKKKSVC